MNISHRSGKVLCLIFDEIRTGGLLKERKKIKDVYDLCFKYVGHVLFCFPYLQISIA